MEKDPAVVAKCTVGGPWATLFKVLVVSSCAKVLTVRKYWSQEAGAIYPAAKGPKEVKTPSVPTLLPAELASLSTFWTHPVVFGCVLNVLLK